MPEIHEITGAWEVRYGTDGVGLVNGYVHADTMDGARTLAAFKLAHDGYPIIAEKGYFTVHKLAFDLTETDSLDRLIADVAERIENVSIADGYRYTPTGRLIRDMVLADGAAQFTADSVRLAAVETGRMPVNRTDWDRPAE